MICFRYGKYRPPNPDIITFTTNFGVFICFDLMFEEPAITLLNEGIKNFVYPTMWVSELPFLIAVQIQRIWAYTNNVNLLAADAKRIETATFGSGVYAGQQGSLVEFIPNGSTTKVIVTDVPNRIRHRSIVSKENVRFLVIMILSKKYQPLKLNLIFGKRI